MLKAEHAECHVTSQVLNGRLSLGCSRLQEAWLKTGHSLAAHVKSDTKASRWGWRPAEVQSGDGWSQNQAGGQQWGRGEVSESGSSAWHVPWETEHRVDADTSWQMPGEVFWAQFGKLNTPSQDSSPVVCQAFVSSHYCPFVSSAGSAHITARPSHGHCSAGAGNRADMTQGFVTTFAFYTL